MSYDPQLISDIDWMRFRLNDINVAKEFAPDSTYQAHLDSAGTDWRLAAAAMARGFAARAANAVQSFTAVGDMSTAWNRSASDWLKIAGELEAEAARLTPVNSGGFWSATTERGDLDSEPYEYSVGLRR